MSQYFHWWQAWEDVSSALLQVEKSRISRYSWAVEADRNTLELIIMFFFFFLLRSIWFHWMSWPGGMWNYRACSISILQELPNEARSIQRGQNNKYSLRKQHWNLHKITITTKSRGNSQESPIHLSSESEPLKWSTFCSLINISWEIDQNQAMKSLDLHTPCLAIQSARLLLSR